MSEDAVAIAQQIGRSSVPRKRFSQLLDGPFRGGMSGYAKVHYATPVMCQDQKDIQDLEAQRRHGKKN
jgi:hypothetical protein